MKTLIYALALLFAGAAVVVVAQGSLPPTQGVASWVWSGSAWVPATSSGGGGGGAATIADGADVTQGAIADTAYASGSGTVVAVLKGIFGKLNAALTVNLPTGASTAANQTTANSSLATIATNTGASIPVGSSVIGKVGIDQTSFGITNGVVVLSSTVGGATGGTILSAASNNSTSIKASAGTLYSLTLIQTTTTLMDVRFYDTASAPTCSSATGMKLNFVAQSNATSAGATYNLGPTGVAFTTGIGVCITGANANNDNTNAATGLNLIYAYN